ncbi:MAG TPA: ornithine carbamoyltransferase [Coriobacteriia bacterium]
MLAGTDILTLGELTPADVRAVIDLAKQQKAAWEAGDRSRPLAGKAAALIFMKPSMRTRVSFEVACGRLGLQPVVLGPGDAFSRGETLEDTTRVLERYADVIVIRTFDQAEVGRIAEVANVPVVNALTDDYHPCQILADLLTIEEHLGRLPGIKLAYVGDGNNIANTLLLGCPLAGVDLTVATPAGYEPLSKAVADGERVAASTGTALTLTHDPVEAVRGADVVVTDTWTSMGQEAEHDERLEAFHGFQVTPELMSFASAEALFMHCMPAHRGEEVVSAVIDGPRSVIIDEAANRLHAQKALLTLVVG